MFDAKLFRWMVILTLCFAGSGEECAAAEAISRHAPKPPLAALPFQLDAGRILVEARFRTPEGAERKALAWFNMGMKAPILTKALYRELGIDRGAPLRLQIGETVLEAAPDTVVDGDGGLGAPVFAQYFGPYPVEAMLPASLFLAHRLTLDYKRRTLVLTPPEGARPAGVGAPINVNPATGLASVDAVIDGQNYAFVIDAGSGYSWMRGAVLAPWLAAHPDWRRAEGAIGAANYNMLDLDFEKRGTLARIPSLSIGALELKNAGFFGTGPILGGFVDGMVGDFFWDNWQKSASGPVVGWLGANALEGFSLTLDYPARMSYWRANGAPDPHDLDTVGVTLVRRDGRYFIGGVAQPAENVLIGDELLAIGELSAPGAARGAVIDALHGKPGEIRRLTLARDGAARQVDLPALDLH
jgi:hypothetical protein